jgi:Fe-S-cluster-containing hydrogenase component 2
MGIHRNVIHPRFGNFILLGTVLIGAEATTYDQPIPYNPCLECKLCVAACPVGAVKPDGAFDFSACANHNYREFMAGFTDWVEKIADSPNAAGYRRRVTDSESASMWQSLSFGANYKAAYCLAVCPAGEDVIGPFVADRQAHVEEHLRPLQRKVETLYVAAGSDAEEYAARKYPHKRLRRVGGMRPDSVASFLGGLPHFFQPGKAGALKARYHFTFTGAEEAKGTVVIEGGRVAVREGLHGEADCAVTADAATWVGFLRKERSIVWAVIWRSVRVKGPLRLLTAFGKCFPL